MLRYGGFGARHGDAPPTRLGLRAGERAVWSGRARAAWALPVIAASKRYDC